MGALDQFLENTKYDCKRLHTDWTDAKEKFEKAWTLWKKENRAEKVREMEVEYKKLKFDLDLGPKLDKVHKEKERAAFVKRADRVLGAVILYQDRLQRFKLPREVEEPLQDSLKRINKKIKEIQENVPLVFKEVEKDEEEESVRVRLTDKELRAGIAKHELSVSDIQKDLKKFAMEFYRSSSHSVITLTLDGLRLEHQPNGIVRAKESLERIVQSFTEAMEDALPQKIKAMIDELER